MEYVEEGLMIKNFTEDDNGVYECRVAVKSTGGLKKRDITVEAFSKTRRRMDFKKRDAITPNKVAP